MTETQPQPSDPSPAPVAPSHPALAFEARTAAAFLVAIVDSSDDAIVGKTLDGIIRSWNRGAERLFGYTAAEAVGQPITLIIPPELREEERGILARLARGERIDHFETVRVAKDGTRLDVSLTVSPIRDPEGRIIGASKIARDITAWKRFQERIAESEARFRALADNIAQLAWMADPQGSIFWLNRRWFEYTGADRSASCGWAWERFHHPEHRDRVIAGYRAAVERGEPWEDTFPLRRHDGAWHWFLSRAVPIYDAQDRVAMWFGTNTDITERMELERALRLADRRKDEFLATLAHELRNPLAPIASGVELLRLRGDDPEVSAKVLRTLERQTGNLVRLVDDLLDVSRITRGKVDLRRARIDLDKVVAGAVEASKPLLDAAGHELVVRLPEEPVRLDADPLRLGQVFANLLNNAAKYTPPGGRVEISVDRLDGDAAVTIEDTGVGFTADVADSLFELFVQGDPGETRASGLGIGLTLVRSLVEMHGGEVSAESPGPGKGSRFTVRLPLADESAPAPEEPAEAASAVAARNDELRVLVADDNRDAADAMCELLTVLGHEARAVYDGESALAAAAEWRPQVALLDLGMPGLDGYETARRLREQSSGQPPVLIALTGWGQADDRRRTREAGFDHHLVKPADLDALRSLLDEVARSVTTG